MNRTGQLFWKHVKLFGIICEISFRESGITPSPDNLIYWVSCLPILFSPYGYFGQAVLYTNLMVIVIIL